MYFDDMFWRRERPVEFQWVDLKVVKLQIRKVRDPSRWRERDEKELAQLIERREHYSRSSETLDQEDKPRGIAGARPRGVVATLKDCLIAMLGLVLLIAFAILIPFPVLVVFVLVVAVMALAAVI